MLVYVSPARVTNAQLDLLERGFSACPVKDRWTRQEICEALLAVRCYAFEVSGAGMMLVSVHERNGQRVLSLDAFARGKISSVRTWLGDLKRLALDWSCDKIETTIFNPRLARAIQLCGARQQAVVLELEVSRGD